jgi:two-component system, cell cycle sensor histidine kinase and response regulator CckA
MNILVVDDDVAVLRLVATILRAYGHEVLEANDGPDALRVARHSGIRLDLLVTDVVMPGMNGPALAEALAESGLIEKSLLISGFVDLPGKSGRDAGLAAPVLRKPFSPAELLEAVERAAGNGRVRGAA